MAYSLASTTWDNEEYDVLNDVIKSGRFTMGERVRQYEAEFAQHFGKRYAVMTSSGSTANLLAMAAAFWHPDLGWRAGDEIIVPAVSWSTTYFPVTQAGLTLRFVDVDPATMNIDLDKLADAITPKTKAVFAVNLLGNPVQASRLRKICEDAGILLLEDNCESMGASFNGEMAGAFGLFGTFSSFFSHHICTMEGGMVITDDRKLYDNMLSMRAHGWVRDLPEDTHLPFDPDPFVRQFRFVLPGYNVRPLEMEGALGTPQLKKLPGFVAARRENAKYFQELFSAFDGLIDLQKETGESSWFGFAMVLNGPLSGRRKELVGALQAAGIECRPIVTGNFLKNPVIDKLPHTIGSEIVAAERIDNDGLFVGNHHYPIRENIELLHSVVRGFVSQNVSK